MHDCDEFAELIMVWGNLKTYRCTECEKEWDEKEENKIYMKTYLLGEINNMYK